MDSKTFCLTNKFSLLQEKQIDMNFFCVYDHTWLVTFPVRVGPPGWYVPDWGKANKRGVAALGDVIKAAAAAAAETAAVTSEEVTAGVETAVVVTAERGLAAAIVDRYAHFSTFFKDNNVSRRYESHISPDCDWVMGTLCWPISYGQSWNQ